MKDPGRIRDRITKLLGDGTLETIDGGVLRMSVDSILVHSDTPGAVQLGETIRSAVLAAGAQIAPLSSSDPAQQDMPPYRPAGDG